MGGVSAGVPPGQHAPQRGLSSVSGASPRDEEGQRGRMYLDPQMLWWKPEMAVTHSVRIDGNPSA